jgi:LCP family protein required for cell wall assembly
MPGRTAHRRLGWKIAAVMSVLAAAAVVAGVLTAYLNERAVWDSIHRVQVTDLGKRPPVYNHAMNLLVFASGSTAGLTRHQEVAWHVGHDSGDAVSETIMVVHISPGRHEVTILNIPRETVVPVYQCAKGPDWQGQRASPSSTEIIGFSLSYGGPACLWKTVEHQTGIHLDHFIELGYLGLVKVINDIGGVSVCVPAAVNDPYSGLKISAGPHHINGVTFLKFWRTREATGNGSDLQRIQRDDFLLAEALHKIRRTGLLSSPARLLGVIRDAAASMTTDAGLSQADMLQIAESLSSVPSQNYQFIQAPTVLYPPNPNWVQFTRHDKRLFAAIAHDATLASVHRQARRAAGAGPVLDTALPKPRPGVLNRAAARSPAPRHTRPGSSGKPREHGVSGLAKRYGGITGAASCRSVKNAFLP